MQQLSGLDASFLYFETANAPMHVGGLLIYDPSTALGGNAKPATKRAPHKKVAARTKKLAAAPANKNSGQ